MRRRAIAVLETIAEPMARFPLAFGHALAATDLAVHGATEVALVGDPGAADFAALARVVASRYVPSLVLAGGKPADADGIGLLAGRNARQGKATASLCRGYVCEEPVTEPAKLLEQLSALGRVPG